MTATQNLFEKAVAKALKDLEQGPQGRRRRQEGQRPT